MCPQVGSPPDVPPDLKQSGQHHHRIPLLIQAVKNVFNTVCFVNSATLSFWSNLSQWSKKDGLSWALLSWHFIWQFKLPFYNDVKLYLGFLVIEMRIFSRIMAILMVCFLLCFKKHNWNLVCYNLQWYVLHDWGAGWSFRGFCMWVPS